MRTRKRVLLYCAEEVRAGRMAFILGVRGFAATACDSAELLAHELDFSLPDAVLILEHGEGDHCEGLIRRIQQRRPALPIALLTCGRSVFATNANVVLPFDADTAVVIERLRMLVACKRGPRTAHAEPQTGYDLVGDAMETAFSASKETA